MGCLALFLNFLLPGLGTILFTNKRIQGFFQLVLTILNIFLMIATLGLTSIIHLGLFVWALATTITFMSEQSAKKAMQAERDRQPYSDEPWV